MKYLSKDLFSHRHNLVSTSPVILRETISLAVRNAIGSCYDILCQSLKKYQSENLYHSWQNAFLPYDIEKELWIHFANRRLAHFEEHGNYHLVFNEFLSNAQSPWYRILDLVEYVCKWIRINIDSYSYLNVFLNEFESNINNEFDRLDYGYRIVNHCVTDITSEIEIASISEAIVHSKDNVSSHIKKAVEHFSARPVADVRNSIKESISAVEAVCRELTGDSTLGQALKHLEDNGVLIHRMLKEEFTKFYAYTNDPSNGIRHALMDSDSTYSPSKDEAYYMLLSCSAFANYLRRKVAP